MTCEGQMYEEHRLLIRKIAEKKQNLKM